MTTFTQLAEHYLAGRRVSPAYQRHVRFCSVEEVF
jgi:hypothetical protein